MCQPNCRVHSFAFITSASLIVGGFVSARAVAEPLPPPTARPAEDAERPRASVSSDNFRVDAPSERIAQVIADAAERERKARALLWLGKELPTWSDHCTMRVNITTRTPAGFTNVRFDNGKILAREIEVKGALEDILACVLPHEITHTIFADYFGEPMPRWADEGAAVLSEDKIIHQKYHTDLGSLLKTPGRALPLRRLLAVSDYPDDPKALYTEGFTLTEFLVDAKDRKTFLQFLKQGKRDGWEKSLKENYGYSDIDKLEDAWLTAMKK